MSAFSSWIVGFGLNPEAIMRRGLGGVVLGLTVVAIDRVVGFGS